MKEIGMKNIIRNPLRIFTEALDSFKRIDVNKHVFFLPDQKKVVTRKRNFLMGFFFFNQVFVLSLTSSKAAD